MEDLQIVRGIRVILWWGSWVGLIGGIVAIVVSAAQASPFTQSSWPMFALQVIPQATVPFMGWALVTILLRIHGLLAETNEEDYEDDSDLDEDDSEGPNESPSEP